MTTVVSEKWMERFVLNLDDLCSDVLASGEDHAGGSSDVGSDACIFPDQLPTVVSLWTVVVEEWMDWFVINLVECPSVSSWGEGGVCRCIPPGRGRIRYTASV